jgi:hypothetical protein
VSLHELLVACALVGLVMGTTYTLLAEGLRAYTIGMARAESQQAARVAVARLSAEARMAGRGPDPTVLALPVVEPERVVLDADLDADGDTTGRGERVTWRRDGRVLRRHAGGGAQPVVNGVRRFELAYFDEAGVPTTDPRAARAVAITVVTEPDRSVGDLGRGVAVTMTTRVRLRNR